jgi:hypothetical protein
MLRLVEFAAREDKDRSWAIRPRPSDAAHFEAWSIRTKCLQDLGVENVEADLATFISDLRHQLLTL